MTSSPRHSDAEIDAALCDVRLPSGLLARLRGLRHEPRDADEATDTGAVLSHLADQLADVPLPVGMLQRLHEIGSTQPAPDVDTTLRTAEVPAGLRERLHRLSRPRVARWDLGQVVAASVLWVSTGLAYFAAMAILLLFVREPAETADLGDLARQVVSQPGPFVEYPDVVATILANFEQEPLPQRPAPIEIAFQDPHQRPATPTLLPNAVTEPVRFVRALGPYWQAQPGGGDESWFGGAVDGRDDVAEIEFGPELAPRGMAPANLRGFDSRYFLRHDEWPVIWLKDGVDPRLWVSQPPLEAREDSFHLAQDYVSKGQTPPADKLRKAEFLAAVDYDFPRPDRQTLGLRIAGGPSPFSEPGLYLLQVGVQAGHARAPKRPPAHVVALVDTSGSMNSAGRLGVVRRALAAMAETLGEGDRMSIIAFGAGAEIVIEDAGQEHLADLLAAIASLRARGASRVAEGLQLAHTLVRGSQAARFHVALFSDGMSELEPRTHERIHAMLASDLQRGVRWSVVDLGAASAQRRRPLEALAGSGGGDVYSARAFDEVRAALARMLTGRSQVIADNVTLKLTFNRELVEAFRLIGHERGGAGLLFDEGSDSHGSAVTFQAGQASTLLFEVKLRPVVSGGYPDLSLVRDTVATARLAWKTPRGESRRTVRRIGQAPFARSFQESAMPLQFAALVAETAEILAQSPYAKGSSLSQVLQQAKQANFQLKRRRSFVEFIDFVRTAARR